MPKWTEKDHVSALKRGWILTNNAFERLTIARVDDPPAWEEDLLYTEPLFDSDDEAMACVVILASYRDPTAMKALSLVGKPARFGSRGKQTKEELEAVEEVLGYCIEKGTQ